jgi:hypothetical protein
MGLSVLGSQLFESLKPLSLSEVVGLVGGVTIVYVSNVIALHAFFHSLFKVHW